MSRTVQDEARSHLQAAIDTLRGIEGTAPGYDLALRLAEDAFDTINLTTHNSIYGFGRYGEVRTVLLPVEEEAIARHAGGPR